MKLLSIFGHCFHRRVTFPQTRKGQTYVCCLDCGREFAYDLDAMKRGAELVRWPRGDAEAARVVGVER